MCAIKYRKAGLQAAGVIIACHQWDSKYQRPSFLLSLSMPIMQGQFSLQWHGHFPTISRKWNEIFHYYLVWKFSGEVSENYLWIYTWVTTLIISNILVWINISNDSFFWLRSDSICRCQIITKMTHNENISQLSDLTFLFPQQHNDFLKELFIVCLCSWGFFSWSATINVTCAFFVPFLEKIKK